MRSIFLLIPVLFLLPMMPVSGESAELASFQFSGHVTFVQDDDFLDETVHVGASFSGFMSYDLDASDGDGSEGRGLYEFDSPPSALSFRIQAQPFASGPTNTEFLAEVGNAPDFGNKDFFILASTSPGHPSPGWMEILALSFLDDSQTALGNDALPDTFDLADWDGASLNIVGYDVMTGSPGYVIEGEIETIGACSEEPEMCGGPTCSDGLDNDCDGAADLDDTDCAQWCASDMEASTIKGMNEDMQRPLFFVTLALLLMLVRKICFRMLTLQRVEKDRER